MIILGLNAFHVDSSAALVQDGKLIAAAEEERFRRIKHWAGFPSHAIAYCLHDAGVQTSDVEHVALNQDSRANLIRKIGYFPIKRPNINLVLSRVRNRRAREGLQVLLEQALPGQPVRAEFHRIEHHLAHLSSAFHVCPFDERPLLRSMGSAISQARLGGRQMAAKSRPTAEYIFHIRSASSIRHSRSISVFRITATSTRWGSHHTAAPCSWTPCGRLCPNGGFELDLEFFRHHREDVSYQWAGGSPEFGDLFSSRLEDLLGPRRQPADPLEDRHRDIARSAQALYEEIFFHLLDALQKRCGLTDIALAGGCAMNSVANGKVRRMTAFRRVYVQAAAGDAGGAIGAAYAVWHKLGGKRSFVMNHAYWGPAFGAADIAQLIAAHRSELSATGCTVEEISEEAALCRRTAAAIADGQVVGWFQGWMEWGPRALGNRSILCDPRRVDMKALLNAKIKRRESFRPFAPSVLEEAVSEWFEEDDAVPFMMQVFQIRNEKRNSIPAVTHVDGSGRLQTVSRLTNQRYYRLIDSFRNLTGVPMVLNTSFNENEPAVCEPKEALECFLRTRMDVLVMGDTVVERRPGNGRV
jgi:carbamoyltransferase